MAPGFAACVCFLWLSPLSDLLRSATSVSVTSFYYFFLKDIWKICLIFPSIFPCAWYETTGWAQVDDYLRFNATGKKKMFSLNGPLPGFNWSQGFWDFEFFVCCSCKVYVKQFLYWSKRRLGHFASLYANKTNTRILKNIGLLTASLFNFVALQSCFRAAIGNLDLHKQF